MLNIPAIHLTLFHSDMCIIKLVNKIVIFLGAGIE
jgi:hypothetical protein